MWQAGDVRALLLDRAVTVRANRPTGCARYSYWTDLFNFIYSYCFTLTTKYCLKAKQLPYLNKDISSRNIQVSQPTIQTRLQPGRIKCFTSIILLILVQFISPSISTTYYLFTYLPHSTKRHVDDSITALTNDLPIAHSWLLLNIRIDERKKPSENKL